MDPVNFYKNLIENSLHEEALQWLKNDENFLCGLEIKDYNLDVYLFYAGETKVIYFAFFNDKLLFYGDDFKPSGTYEYDSLETAVTLLSFLTLQKGDVDTEYFKNYNDLQLFWSKSMYCNHLKLYCNHFMNYDQIDPKPDQIEAKKCFENWFIG